MDYGFDTLRSLHRTSQRQSYRAPTFLTWSSSNIEVDKIVMSDTVTTVYIKAFYRPKYWIKIASGSFLKDEKGPYTRSAKV